MSVFEEKIKEFQEKQAEIRKLRMELTHKEGEFNKEFGEWVKSWSGSESFTVPELIEKVWRMPRD